MSASEEYALVLCRAALGKFSAKRRVSLIQKLMSESLQELKDPPKPDPRQTKLFDDDKR